MRHASHFLSSSVGIIKNHSVSVLNIMIAVSTIGIEQIFSKAVFVCPCADQNPMKNRIYGMVYLVAPAVVLLILGYALNSSTWRMFTGICKRTTNRFGDVGCYITFQILMRSLVAPISWICIGLLDGKYYACSMASNPYDQPCIEIYTTRNVQFSIEYHKFVAESQVIGWLVTAVSFITGAVLCTVVRCCSSLTHWQRQYMLWTKDIESGVFEEMAKEEIRKDAEKNLQILFAHQRSKNDWDQITAMFFIKNMKSKSLTNYSALQNWIADTSTKKDETLASHDVTVPNNTLDISMNTITTSFASEPV